MADQWPGTPYDPNDAPQLRALGKAIRGHEGAGPGVISPQGAVGTGQVMPDTFRQYANPGESLSNDQDVIRVSDRIIRDLYYKHGRDAQRVATGYFSGEKNISPEGASRPWRANVRDVNEPVSAYVANVEKNLPQQWPGKPLEKWPGQPLQRGALHDRDLGKLPKMQIKRLDLQQAGSRPARPVTPTPTEGVAGRVAEWVKARLPSWEELKSPDWLSDKLGDVTNWTAEKIQGAAETAFTKAGVPNPGRAARDLTQYLLEFAPMQGGLGARVPRIESPAIKTPEGVVEGPNHPAIRETGVEGQPGFTTNKGEFVNRGEGADIAKQTGQAMPGTGEHLHSEDLQGTPKASPPPEAAARRAEETGVAPQSAGAAATDKAVLQSYQAVPPVPTKQFIQSTDDSFFRLRQSAVADKAQALQDIRQWPAEALTPEMQKKFFEAGEPDSKVKLTPEEQSLFDRTLRPWKQEEYALWREAQKSPIGLDLKEFDPEYQHRMVKGKSKEFDPWTEGSEATSPVQGYRARSTASMKDRLYYAIESESGKRRTVRIDDRGPVIVEKGEATPLPRYEGAATKPGDKFTVDGEKWTVKQANTSEIEHATQGKVQYYKNAAASTAKNVMQLRAVVRAIHEVERLKQTPEWDAYTIKDRPGANIPEGWRRSEFPPYRGYYFEPKFANVIDDFWSHRKAALGEALAAINRFTVTSMFYSPVPHALNAGAHWVTARGWDWVTPKGMKSLAIDTARAVREVVTQGPEYQRMLREGSGLVYGSVANQEFYRMLLQTLGEDVKRQPAKWDPIARAMGVGPSDLVRMLYNVSSRALWATSDAFMLQRVFELQRKGMSTRAAIADAEKHIPNYRIPPEVLGSRTFALALKDPSLTAFSRYHYGQWKSYAHMAKDLAVGTPKQKFEAMGNILATAILGALVWPMINRGIQKLTGNQDLEIGPKGSLTIPTNIWDAWRGKPLDQVVQGSITLSPVIKFGIEEFFNTDLFTKRNIREPGDWEAHRYGRTAAQTGEHAAQSLVSPYGTAARGLSGEKPIGIAASLAKQGLGLRKPFKPYHGYSGGGTPEEQAQKRYQRPRGPIEELEKRAEQWLGR